MIEKLIEILNDTNAGFISAKAGKYTIIVTDDEDGAKMLSEALDKYVEDE